MANSEAPDEMAHYLDVHCLQKYLSAGLLELFGSYLKTDFHLAPKHQSQLQ